LFEKSPKPSRAAQNAHAKRSSPGISCKYELDAMSSCDKDTNETSPKKKVEWQPTKQFQGRLNSLKIQISKVSYSRTLGMKI